MRILIIGGVGCFGLNLIEEWILKGFDVLVIDNFVIGKCEVFFEVKGFIVVEGLVIDKLFID